MAFVRMDRWVPSDAYEIIYREHGVGLVRLKKAVP
jgi:hypothetical protein